MILVAVSFLVAVVLALLTGVPYIDFLRKRLYGQSIRDVAPKSHELSRVRQLRVVYLS